MSEKEKKKKKKEIEIPEEGEKEKKKKKKEIEIVIPEKETRKSSIASIESSECSDDTVVSKKQTDATPPLVQIQSQDPQPIDDNSDKADEPEESVSSSRAKYKPSTHWKALWRKEIEDLENIPHGLQYLKDLDAVIMEKIPYDHLNTINPDIILPFQIKAAFNIFDKHGKQIFYAFEDSSLCIDKFSTPHRRSLTIHLTDRDGKDVCKFIRDFTFCTGCFCCACTSFCADNVTVWHTEADTPIGFVNNDCSLMYPIYSVLGPKQMVRYKLQGGCFCFNCFSTNKDFRIIVAGLSKEVGKISQNWTGLATERFGACECQFGLHFPTEEAPGIKVIMLAGAFLINTMYYEQY